MLNIYRDVGDSSTKSLKSKYVSKSEDNLCKVSLFWHTTLGLFSTQSLKKNLNLALLALDFRCVLVISSLGSFWSGVKHDKIGNFVQTCARF